ncbi:hypothetical protein COO59_16440 [Mixta theicola]|uniref:Transcriptional regulator n=1 Tax=Mixta theicola TaxID=1458355 RepID=A0A2K1Q6W0_9GAMM|nr:hypothetical protein [Mixta theicola]PNS10697.1 hypothetical protein COO59_16440 [Mixta theicola]GLR10911.1 hypothetical protein GCM10007905_36310 [Mixta theicola]
MFRVTAFQRVVIRIQPGREPQDELKLKFEAIKQMDEEEMKSVTSILDALILKHQARRVLGLI